MEAEIRNIEEDITIDTETKMVRVNLSADLSNSDMPLSEFQDTIDQMRAQIPPEYLGEAEIQTEYCILSFERPATAEELAKQEEVDAEWTRRAEERERREYERLHAKYGPKPEQEAA